MPSPVRPMSLLAAPLPAEEEALAMKEMDTELVYLLEAAKIPSYIIAKIGHLGYTEVETFAHMESEAKEVWRLLKDDVGLDPAGGPSTAACLRRSWHVGKPPESAHSAEQRRRRPSGSGICPAISPRLDIWSW